MVTGIGFLLRFLTGRWKSMRVIEEQPVESESANLQPHIVRPFVNVDSSVPASYEPASCE
jgi:hypothetical protein